MAKDIPCCNESEKSGIALWVSGKMDFRTRKIIGDKEGTLHNDKVVTFPRQHRNPQGVCIEQESIKTHEAKTNSLERAIDKSTIIARDTHKKLPTLLVINILRSQKTHRDINYLTCAIN